DCDKLKTEKERDFFKFLKGQGAESDFSRRLESKVLLARKNAIWRKQYMTWQQTIDEEKEIAFQKGKDAGIALGINQGISQGAEEKAISAAKNLLKLNILTPEQIAEATALPMETVLELKASL
ncbi:MAG: hypothetical protein K5873_08940, partial [Treponema sp.]|nr:hypothetical protein [Treponema sp.]